MALLRRGAIILFAILATGSAQGAELPQLLNSALARGETANAVRWAFTQHVRNDEIDLTMRFQPGAQSGEWQLLSPDGGTLNEDQAEAFARLTDLRDDPDPDSDLTYEQLRTSIGDQELEVIEDTPEHTIFTFAPQPWDDIEEDEVGLLAHLRAEITVNKNGSYISRIRLYAPERFHHMVVVRIDSFEQEMIFELEEMTGLPLMSLFSQRIEGSVLFQRISRGREERYGDFIPMSRDGAALVCSPTICAQEFLAAE